MHTRARAHTQASHLQVLLHSRPSRTKLSDKNAEQRQKPLPIDLRPFIGRHLLGEEGAGIVQRQNLEED